MFKWVLIFMLFATPAYAACGEGTTTNYALCKPSDGDTSWGANYRTTVDAIDTQMKTNADAAALNTTHSSSNGSDHSYIDQDVTSGSSPTLDGSNITGVSSTVDEGAVYTWTGLHTFNSTMSVNGAATFGSTMTGTLTGNADTATALAANPSDCAANNFATTIAANGNLTCAQPAEADISDLVHTATSDTTWTNHNSYPAACTAGSYAHTIGDTLTCTDASTEIDSIVATHTSDVDAHHTAGNGLTYTGSVLHFDGGNTPAGELGNTWASPTIDATHSGSAHHSAVTVSGTPNYITLSGQDIVRAKLDVSDDTNMTAGRSLTLTANDVVADAELYTGQAGRIAFEDPVATDDFFFNEISVNQTATSIYCKTLVGTVDLDVQIGGVDINGTDITCNTTGVLDSSLAGDTDLNTGEELSLAITSVASSPTYLMVIVNSTKDD